MSERMPQSAKKVEQMETDLNPHEKEVIRELEYPIQRILQQLTPELEEGAYKLIIGDDVSGRIPAIVMNEAIRKIYKVYGHPAPMLRFVAGGRRTQEENILQEFAREGDMRKRVSGMNDQLLDANVAPRALLVTEAIATGDGMKSVVQALERNRIKADIAAVAFIGSKVGAKLPDVQKRLKSARIIVGSEHQPKVYGHGMRYMHGVSKENGTATATRFTDYLIHREEAQETQMKVNAARVLATSVGSDIADVFLVGKEQKAA